MSRAAIRDTITPVEARTTPWWGRIPEILTYPLNTGGMIALVVLTLVAGFEAVGRYGMFRMIGTVIASGVLFSVVFLVIRHSAKGSKEFPAVSEIEDPVDHVLVPGLKVTALGILLYLPAIYCLINGAWGAAQVGGDLMMRGGAAGKPPAAGRPGEPPPIFGVPDGWNASPSDSTDGEESALFDDPEEQAALMRDAAKAAGWLAAAIAAAVVSSLLYPLCLIILAMSGSLRAAIFPWTWFVILKQVPLGYLGLLLGLGAGGVLVAVVTLPLTLLPIPLLPGILATVIRLYVTLCGAHLLGWFVWQNRERLGIGAEPEHREVPVGEVAAMATAAHGAGGAPGYRPAGMVRAGTAPAPVPSAPATEVPGTPPAAAPWDAGQAPQEQEIAGLHARFQAACAARDAATVAQSAPALVDACWEAGDAARAAEVFRGLLSVAPETSLGPERLGRLGKELEAAGDLLAAMTAWRTLALAHPEHPRAPSALWRCVEICDKQNRADWVRSACDAILARYPMSEVAPLAQARLKKLAG